MNGIRKLRQVNRQKQEVTEKKKEMSKNEVPVLSYRQGKRQSNPEHLLLVFFSLRRYNRHAIFTLVSTDSLGEV